MAIRGKITDNAPLGAQGWFKCGGAAERLFKPADQQDLQEILASWPGDCHVFGALSNTIIRDGGLPGLTVRLGREFAQIEVIPDHCVSVGAFALDANVAKVVADAGISGLEFLSGIPGTIGGALRMNAGCYGREIKDVLLFCEALSPDGALHKLTPHDMHLSYRHNDLPEGWIFLRAVLQGEQGDPEAIRRQLHDIKQKREESQPIREKTGGSTFANPSEAELDGAGLAAGTKVWQLIDRVGGRGLRVGGAQMSEKHCNFMINTGSATATDLERLGEEVRRRVREACGITLRWEIRRIGRGALQE
ncbi:MAG: UDP-N-acetylmuramate dehydrogenase [Rhodospirillales bacterium]|nr:UDP-N-acetylmuramate dehydrogenase [Rhodospirillales bacterium]MCB9979582.1 UDP-N-acetylmuramate dehydrogenase [Rhodospirillales bacterium]